MESPKTIHDFSGFSKELQEFQYPAPGEPILAKKISSIETFKAINIELEKWGLDHGTWSVLTHLFPEADIPVLQLSLDQTAPMKSHFELGEKIKFLRSEGVMIIGSGNIVHNLRQANWTPEAKPSAEAAEFDEWVMEKINERDFNSLIHKPLESRAGQFSNPTIEHYLPLLYILGASDSEDKIHVDYKGIENSSVSMRCIRFT
jgi:4,5-DOPA dioxygenase extradiol